MDFYRINNDHNKVAEGIRNYNSTPIFVVYRNGIPFYYKNTFFSNEIFTQFLEITKALNIFDAGTLDKAVEDRMAHENILSDLK